MGLELQSKRKFASPLSKRKAELSNFSWLYPRSYRTLSGKFVAALSKNKVATGEVREKLRRELPTALNRQRL